MDIQVVSSLRLLQRVLLWTFLSILLVNIHMQTSGLGWWVIEEPLKSICSVLISIMPNGFSDVVFLVIHLTFLTFLSFSLQKTYFAHNGYLTKNHYIILYIVCVCVCVCVSCLAISNSLQFMDCSPSGSSVHGILEYPARILERIAMPFSRYITYVCIYPYLCLSLLYLIELNIIITLISQQSNMLCWGQKGCEVSWGWLGEFPFPPEIWVSKGFIHWCIAVALCLNSRSWYNFFLVLVDQMEANLWEEVKLMKKKFIFPPQCRNGNERVTVGCLEKRNEIFGEGTIQ